MAAVVLEGVVKRFEGFTAVHGLDLEVEAGEFVSLLGPSGCGKTTTLRMLAGLEFPTAGTIRIEGRIVNDVAPGKRDIAMVFQSYALYPHMTVAENIAYPLKKRGMGRAERATRVAETAALLQLSELLQRRPRQLSGGQQQRVALGRALVRDPKVFLLDEPLSNLDAKLRAYMRAELIELHRRLGRTMIYVTHDQLEAMTMSERIAVMNAGRLQQLDTPDAVYNRPANRFVADFIGTPSMNLIEGRIERQDGDLVFRADGFVQPLPTGAVTQATGAAVLGFRPEHVTLGAGEVEGLVRVVEPTGHETIVIFETEAGHRLTARAPAGFRLTPGERAPFRLDVAALHLFAGDEEGRRLNLDAPASRHHGTEDRP